MSDSSKPAVVHQTSANPEDVSPHCPFCTVATHFQPIDPQDVSNPEWDPDKLSPPSYVLLSTKDLVAFMDIAPLTRGHVLVAPRKHRTKVGDLKPYEMAEIGRALPVIARSVLRSVLPDTPHEDADYNIVQNNGPGAAQVIPHVHFHIIPRPPLNYQPPTTTSKQTKYPRSALPTGIQQSYIQFGRGHRHELDDDDAASLVQTMRLHLRDDWTKEFGSPPTSDSVVERFMGGIKDAAWIEGGAGLVSNLARRAGGRREEKL